MPELGRGSAGPAVRILATASCAALAVLIGVTLWMLPGEGPSLAPLVEAEAPRTGVSSRVTAVLLGFRGYDTLLEVTVLLAAALAVRAVASRSRVPPARSPDVAVAALLKIVAPMGIVIGVYLVWRGSHAPGGAFQAGAVLGGASIAIALAGRAALGRLHPGALRALLVVGPCVFLSVGIAGLLTGGAFLEVPTRLGAWAFTALEVALAVSIGLALALLPGDGLPDPSGRAGPVRRPGMGGGRGPGVGGDRGPGRAGDRGPT